MCRNIKNRSYSISKKPNEMWKATCYDSYNEYSENYFKTEEQANEWIYWRWENEDFFQQDSIKLLNRAISNCVEIDTKQGIEPSLD
tara:strand:+ start:185 stop:442 length:258 start_codon:yes stop_codon:yes gene_type:complete